MENSAVEWLSKVIQEHLKNPLDADEWNIAIEFAQQMEREIIKKAFIDGAINMNNNNSIEKNYFSDLE